MTQDDMINNINRLQWACRRGMLELDVLLGNFLRDAYPTLPLEDKSLFVNLLSEEDPLLFAWLMGHEEPEDEALLRITTIIRNYARKGL